MPNLEPYLKPGFTDYQGNVWPISAIDAYNTHTQEINQLLQIDPQPNTLLYKALETLKDNRHKVFVAIAESLPELKVKAIKT